MNWSRLVVGAWSIALGIAVLSAGVVEGQTATHGLRIHVDGGTRADAFQLVQRGRVAPVYVEAGDMPALGAAVRAFCKDVARVSGVEPQLLTALPQPLPANLLIIGIAGHSPWIDELDRKGLLHTHGIRGQWESAVTSVVSHPAPGVRKALVIAGSDRRGAMFALFSLSRRMGVSPWVWWADVPVAHHESIGVSATDVVQAEPSVRYRGIFINDEDWGMRPWAANTLDRAAGNIGPHTYERIFELLLRLHGNLLWPAMHPGTVPFNAIRENAELADRWGIVMGSSHSEALLRNNVGEWDEKKDGPWNYQTNSTAIDAYWQKRLAQNGQFENFYTVGMRGVHDTGLEATGTVEQKARLVEQVLRTQRDLLAKNVNADLRQTPQVLWLYKESLELYRAGMQIPDDVTLGWTDDNYGYIRQLPTESEQKRSGGSAVYYHVSYWGFPHDYLWLCTTPPALIREEMGKAFDHGARRAWVLNVGDLKPAEMDIDFFLQLAWNEPETVRLDQRTYLRRWVAEQFPTDRAHAIADLMQRYFELNFVRKPEFMGFNGYNDNVRRTEFNPLAWPAQNGGQNGTRLRAWRELARAARSLAMRMPASYRSAFFELVEYPIGAAAAQNEKMLYADRTCLDASEGHTAQRKADADRARLAYEQIQRLTAQYNNLENGKWKGMMSSAPRNRSVFDMPPLCEAEAHVALPETWKRDQSETHPELARVPGFVEQHGAVSINATHFVRKRDGAQATWRIIDDLGITPGGSVTYGAAGKPANSDAASGLDAAWLEYSFTTASHGLASLAVFILPTFPMDAAHRLRFGVAVDGGPVQEVDAGGAGEWQEGHAPTWEGNVLRNAAIFRVPLPELASGKHRVQLIYRDPGVVFEHLLVTFAGAPPAYPAPPETRSLTRAQDGR
jgi:hypothetical protein